MNLRLRSTSSGSLLAATGIGLVVALACTGAPPRDEPLRGRFRVHADVDPPARSVTVNWRYVPEYRDFGQADGFVAEAFSTPFVPTFVEVRPPSTLYIAGSADGATRVEAWTLRLPRVEVARDSGSLVLVPRGRERIDSILHLPNARAGPVRTMFWNRGKERSLFLRYVQDFDVHELTWSPGRLGSTTVVVSAAEQPGLATSAYDRYLAGDHSTAGYVYGLHARGRLDLQPSLILFDADRDGVLETSEVCGFDELQARGLKDITRWVEYDGEVLRW